MTPPPVVHLSVSIASISSALIFFQLYLTRRLRPTGFLILITSLAVCNLIYNTGFYFRLNTDWGDAIFYYFLMFSDTTMGVWTNAMSLVLFRIVYTLKSVNIVAEYPSYLFLSLILTVPFIIYSIAVDGLNLTIMDTGFRCYYWIRICIIFINIVLYAATKNLVRHLRFRVEKGELTSDQAENIKVLVGRMRYYGAVQAITRIGPTWHDYNDATHGELNSGLVGASFGTSIGIGYFIVFVYMQPRAWEILRKNYIERYAPFLLPPSLKEETKDQGLSRLTTFNFADMDDDEILMRITSIKRPVSVGNSSKEVELQNNTL